MKHLLLFLITVILSPWLMAQQDTVVQWTFPGNDGFADGGIQINLLKEINTDGGTSAISFKNGATTKAAQATGWDNGAGSKQWLVEFSAAGYEDLHISSKLSSGGNAPGPRDYIMEFKIDCAGIWAPIPGGNLTVANDWTTAAVTNLAMPPACEDAISLFVRWRMISDTASDGSIVDSTGICKIDDIFITGTLSTSISEASQEPEQNIFPNPASDFIMTGIIDPGLSATFVGADGRQVARTPVADDGSIDLSGIPAGVYILRLQDRNGRVIRNHKLIIE